MAEIILLPLHILLRIQSVACNFKWAFILSIFEIWGPHNSGCDDCLLAREPVQSGRRLLTSQKNLLPPCSESRSKPSKLSNLLCLLLADCLAYFSSLKMPAIYSSETSENLYQITRSHIHQAPALFCLFVYLFMYLSSPSIFPLLSVSLLSCLPIFLLPVSLSDINRPKCQIPNVSKTSICKQLFARFGSLPFYFSLLPKLRHTRTPRYWAAQSFPASRPYPFIS